MLLPRRYAWYKLYNLSKGYNKNLTPSDVQTLASNVLLSALAILPYGCARLPPPYDTTTIYGGVAAPYVASSNPVLEYANWAPR